MHRKVGMYDAQWRTACQQLPFKLAAAEGDLTERLALGKKLHILKVGHRGRQRYTNEARATAKGVVTDGFDTDRQNERGKRG